MSFRPRKRYRASHWDYRSNGYYFITICTKDRERFFGDIVDGKMELSKIGQIADWCWCEIQRHCIYVRLDEYVIMPDHMHGIIVISRSDAIYRVATAKNRFGPLIPKSLSVVVHMYKSAVARLSHISGFNDFTWQPRFHDHIIRDHYELTAIRRYIRNNPLQ